VGEAITGVTERKANRMKTTDSKHLWAIVKLPNLEKEFHCYLQHDSSPPASGLQASGLPALSLQHLQLLDADTLETWDFARPIDFLNWIEDKMKYVPKHGGLR
jgi:hypothetical protein